MKLFCTGVVEYRKGGNGMSGMSGMGFVGLFSLFYLLFILAIIGFVVWFMIQLIATQREKAQALKEIAAHLKERNNNTHSL